METILEMKKITKIFPGVRALDEVDFNLRKGEIHALIGENGAGKSTLMKALLGMYEIDGGEIWFKGKKVNFKGPNDALHAGISMIHQEISLVQTMSAAENIWMGRTGRFTKMGIIDHKQLMHETRELCGRLGIQIDPAATVETLSVANMQLVELVRAVSYNADVIVMDEPTSALTDAEIELLYKIVRDLAAQGTSIIFISHKLEEIFEICDRITIMRDGQYIDCRDTTDIDNDELIKLIAGREINNIYTKDHFEKGDIALEVKNLSSTGTFRNISFAVRKGEILGFCGLMGAGRSEIMRAIFGIDPYDSGEILINGKKAVIKNPQDAIKNGIGMVTEDRLRQGAIHSLDIKTNMSLPFLPQLSKMGFVYDAKEREQCEQMAKKMSVNMVSFANNIGSLSGGNQQKVIIGRWLLMDPDILILDEPTRGIDVGAKSEIYKIMNDLAKQGMAIIMVSSEMPEILGMSDRIAVVREGEIVCIMENEGLEQQTLLAHAFGVANKISESQQMKTMKKVLTIAVIAIMAFSLFACSSGTPAAEEPSGEATGTEETASAGAEGAGEKETLTIGFSWRSLDEGMTVWWDGTEAAINEYNEGDNPYTIEYFFTNAESGVDKQISDVESLIVREPDVICIQAVDANGSVPAYEACVEAGIPVIDFGYNVNYDQCTTVYKTIDHYKAGELQAEWVNDYLEENPDETLQVGYILGLAGVEDMTVRMNGFVENVNPDRVEVVATKNCDFQASLAQSTAEDWMQAFPEMNAIVACNDEMCVGALQAFKSAGAPVIALGLDGGASALQEISEGNMAATVAFDFEVMATEGVNLAIGVASGEYTDPVFDITQSAAVLIDASNVQEYL